MREPVASSDLLQRIPAFLGRLRDLDAFDVALVDLALDASDLRPDDDIGGDRDWLVFEHRGDDTASFERRLRLAITRLLGKPTGGNKHWDAGCATASIVCRAGADPEVTLFLRPQYSVTNLRDASAAWLDGAEIRPWLVESGFVDSAAEPDADGGWPHPEPNLSGAWVRTTAAMPARVEFFMDSGVRPPGVKGNTDEERWYATLAFLAERLGEPERPTWWRRGSRTVRVESMRSSSRSITLAEGPPGKALGPLGSLSTIPTTAAPDPRDAVTALRSLAEVRGVPAGEAAVALVTAGVVGPEPPARRLRRLVLQDPAGRGVELDLVDDRVAGGTVEATAARSWDAVQEAFTAAFGDSESHGYDRQWRVGAMAVRHAGRSGDDGFERLLARIGEDTAAAFRLARDWLVWDEPFAASPVLEDAWQARCLGAAISGGVVPAVVPGQPVWRLDDRMLWLEDRVLRQAGPGAWPDWATAMPAGGLSAPVPRGLVAGFVEIVRGWRAAGPEEAVGAMASLGWTTADPDVASHPSRTHAGVMLLQPAGAHLSLFLGDGAIRHWSVDVAASADRVVVDGARQALVDVLQPYADRASGGWILGEYAVRVSGSTSARAEYVRLEGTRRPGAQN